MNPTTADREDRTLEALVARAAKLRGEDPRDLPARPTA